MMIPRLYCDTEISKLTIAKTPIINSTASGFSRPVLKGLQLDIDNPDDVSTIEVQPASALNQVT